MCIFTFWYPYVMLWMWALFPYIDNSSTQILYKEILFRTNYSHNALLRFKLYKWLTNQTIIIGFNLRIKCNSHILTFLTKQFIANCIKSKRCRYSNGFSFNRYAYIIYIKLHNILLLTIICKLSTTLLLLLILINKTTTNYVDINWIFLNLFELIYKS